MTKLQDLITHLRELNQKRTPGEWMHEEYEGVRCISGSDGGVTSEMCDNPWDDSEFICELANSLETILAVLEIQEEALKFYADYMNYSIDYDTSKNGFSRRCILYRDIEERNEAIGLAGRRAREAQAKIQKLLEGKE